MDKKRNYFEERPPRLAALLLRVVLRGERRESVCGDLEEEWRAEIRRMGRRAARQWYWRSAWQSALGERRVAPPTEEAIEKGRDRGGRMESIWQDLRYAIRGLRNAPGFTAVAVLTLALGIGANTAIFTVVEAALLRSLPYGDASRLVHLWETHTNRPPNRMEASYPNYLDWRAQNTVFEGIAGYNRTNFTLTGSGAPERVSATRVTANFFAVLGVPPQLGRSLAPEEEDSPANPVALVTHGFWQRRLGGRSDALGAKVNLNGTPFTVIGVLPQSFYFVADGGSEIFVPLMMGEANRTRRGFHWFWPIARLKPGVSLQQANAELAGMATRLAQTYHATNAETSAFAVPLQEQVVGEIRPMLLVLFAAVTLLLLLACVNVANLLLARGSARMREIAVRAALGASRWRLLRQLLMESLLISFLGGALALAVAQAGATLLVGLLPASFVIRMPILRELTLQPMVFLFALGVTLLTGVLFGLGPAWHATKASLVDTLKDGGGAGASRARQRVRSVLVVAQVSLALVLLAGTGLVLRSLQQLLEVHPGFRTEQLMTFRLSLPGAKYQDAAVGPFYQRLEERAAALPGVRGVGVIDEMPLTNDGGTGDLFVEGRPEPPPGQRQETVMRSASPGYFPMMGIRLVAGRFFEPRDNPSVPMVALLTESLAQRIFPNEDPIGHDVYVNFGRKILMHVVGVVGDVKMAGLDSPIRPALYTCSLQDPSHSSWLLLRSEGDIAQMAAAVRGQVAQIDPELAVYGVRTAEQLLALNDGVFVRRSLSMLLGAFAVVAILLAGLGLYGVMNYAVALRVREIGLRMALGARAADVLRMVLGEGMLLAVLGAVVGLAIALGVTRLMQKLLFGISPSDPLTFAAVCAILLIVGALACAIPARRAARVDPLVALRHE